MFARELHGVHYEARGAETALESVMLPECGLHGMQVAVRREPLYGDDIRALHMRGQNVAGLGGAAIDVHGARPTLSRVAADVRAGEAQMRAQELDEQRARVDFRADGFPVDGHRDGNAHGFSRVTPTCPAAIGCEP